MITADPNDASAHYERGRKLADQEHFDKAIEQYRKADELSQGDPPQRKRVLLNWGRALRLRGRYDEAAEKYGEALGIDPKCPWDYYGLGRVLADQERFDEAIEQYRKADELWQKDQSKNRKYALSNWGNALRLKKKDYGEAAGKYQEAIGIDKDYPAPHHGLGLVLADQDRFAEAIPLYQKAYDLLPRDESKKRISVLYRWAVALHQLNYYDLAAGKYKEAIEIDEDDPSAYFGLCLVLADQDRFAEAIPLYQKAYECWQKTGGEHPKFFPYYWAEALRHCKSYDEAAKKYQEIINVDLKYPWAYYGLGLVLADQEHFNEAIVQYQKADKLWKTSNSKDRKYALYNWGDALRLQKHYDEAAEKYREAIGIDSNDPDAYNGLGRVFADQERFDDAIAQYKKADELCQRTDP